MRRMTPAPRMIYSVGGGVLVGIPLGTWAGSKWTSMALNVSRTNLTGTLESDLAIMKQWYEDAVAVGRRWENDAHKTKARLTERDANVRDLQTEVGDGAG